MTQVKSKYFSRSNLIDIRQTVTYLINIAAAMVVKGAPASIIDEKILKGDPMPISGIVIMCQAGRAGELATTINQMPGVDVHHVVDASTLVAVIEAPTVSDEVDLTKELMAMDGVMSVRLAYHNFEDIAR